SNNTQTQSVQQNQPTNQAKDIDAKITGSQSNVVQADQANGQNLDIGHSANISNNTQTQSVQQNQPTNQAKDIDAKITGSQSNVAQANQANEQSLNIGHSENVSNSTQTQQGQKNQALQQSKDLNATITESQLNVAQAGQVGGQNQVIKDGEQVTNSSEINARQQNYPAQQSKDLSVAVDKYTQQKGHIADQTNTQEMVDQVNAPDQTADAVQYEIRTLTASEVKVPNSALYRVNKDSKAGYLIETDPSFTNYKNWLSSDYMLDALGLDPALQQKRLADGFYEQRMVQDQIANLTGYRFLAGYTTDDEQYKALMNNGVTFAKQYGLRPGIALSADQVAQLTSDIVWLVEKDVILKDGTKAKALVPQVYVKARVGDLKGDGTLLSGNSIKFNLDGDLINGATIAGRQAVEITADNVHNLNGRIQGNQVAIEAKKDLNNIGGQIIAKDEMALKAGGNLKVETTTLTSTSQVGGFGASITGVDRIAGLYVGNGSTLQPNQATLVVDVAGNTLLKGAQIKNNSGATLFNGTGNIDIGAVNIGKQEKLFIDNKNGYQLKRQSDIGSEISSNGTLVISGQNITGKAVHLTSQQGDIQLLAQKDIQLDNGLKQSIVDSKTEWKGSFGGKKSSTYNAHETVSLANQLTAGQNIIINSQQGNITATHLQANGGNNIQIQAEQGAVNLLSAIDEKSASSTSSKKNTATYNNRQSGYIDQEVAQTTLKAGNSVDINAGQSIELQANNIQAGQNIYVGNTLMQRQADGTLKAADGSVMPKNVLLSTLETHNQQWEEQQKGYRGIAKELVKGLAIGLPGLQAAAPGLDLQKKLTVGESNSHRTEETHQSGTSLSAENIAVGSSGQTTLTSADLTAKNVALSGQKVILNAAEEQSIESSSHTIETIEGLGVKLNKDSIRLGGFVSEKDKNTLTTTETTHKAGTINTDNLSIKGTEGVDVLGQNIKATGDTTIDHGRGELNIGGYENKTTTEEKTKNEKISTEVGVRNAYLDAALAVVAVKDAASALKDAKNAYSQAQRDYAAGKLTKEALDDSKANVAMATANLASAQIAVAASVAAAAANSGTYGFTIGANGEHIETTATTTTTQGQWQGSHLDLNNLTLKSEDQNANIQGSRLSATGTTTFNGTKDLNITAGIEHGSKESSSKTTSQSVSYTYGGGGGASIGKQTSKSQSESLTHVNSEVNLNRTEGQLNTLNIQGGEVSIADRGNLQVNQIHVESLQDTAKSSNSSKGGSIGAGFGSSGISNVSASYNQSKGSSDSAWVNNTSKLIIGDKDHDANLDAMGVKQVTNIGGVIANATKNADGTLTDHKDLNYSGALELKDLQDHNYNSSRGFNVSTTIGKTTQEKDGEKGKYPNGSTTLGLQSNGQETEQLTKATMGLGTVKNATELTNRDINTTQEITRDQTTGMLNGSVTVDHRLLSESGRAEIVQQQKDLPENLRQSAENVIKALPESEYKSQVLQTLNNVQAKLYKMPTQYKDSGTLGSEVVLGLIKQGVEPQTINKLFDDKAAGMTTVLENLNDLNNKIDHLKQQGLSINDILGTDRNQSPTANDEITFKDYKVEIQNQSTIGMKLLQEINFIGNSIEEISKDTGVDLETVQLAVGLMISGPVRLVVGSAQSLGMDALAGPYKKKGIDVLATAFTASAHSTSTDVVEKMINPQYAKEVPEAERDNYESLSNELSSSKQGAEYLINAAAGIIVGGIGKDIAKKGENGNISSTNNINEEISALNRIKENDKGTDLSNKSSDSIINQQASKRVDEVTAPIDFDGHILNVEISKRGKLTGGHSIANGKVNIVSKSAPNAQGVYEAKISVSDPKNPNKFLTKNSTMFPDSWSADRVKVEVDAAYKNKSIVTNSRGERMWEGITPSGVKVTGYLEPNTTVYPLMK
ncbi:hemagglutinin repeat-containing protein, partial [Acinetobacter nosocomialis]|uniref:hemagglutinin repeat-containing protein n=1 Tax=Acinetobacter nosocomialis TaxID=106654 RepID=UPI003AF56FC6